MIQAAAGRSAPSPRWWTASGSSVLEWSPSPRSPCFSPGATASSWPLWLPAEDSSSSRSRCTTTSPPMSSGWTGTRATSPRGLLVSSLGSALQALRPRWRYAVAALAAALITWPTVVVPVRNLGFALDQGVQLANGQPGQGDFGCGPPCPGHQIAERVVAYIRDHVAADARILSPTHPTYPSPPDAPTPPDSLNSSITPLRRWP